MPTEEEIARARSLRANSPSSLAASRRNARQGNYGDNTDIRVRSQGRTAAGAEDIRSMSPSAGFAARMNDPRAIERARAEMEAQVAANRASAQQAADQEQANVENTATQTGESAPPPAPLFNASQAGIAFSDASDAYANNKKLFLSFFHLASGREVNLKAFVTSFTQNFQSDWNMERVFGRNDPIMTFKNTMRKMGLSFKIPASTLSEAQTNLIRTNYLAKFMYPSYEVANRANTIASPPLMRVRFSNLIGDNTRGSSPHAQEAGLLVAVSSLTITPSFEDDGFFDVDTATLFPKLITVDMDLTALHEHDLGWDDDIEGKDYGFSKFENTNFPFGSRAAPPPPTGPRTPASGDDIEEGEEGVQEEQAAAGEQQVLNAIGSGN